MSNVHPIKPDPADPNGKKHTKAATVAGLVVVGLAAALVLALIIPLAVFLTRLAAGWL